jgi:hypothetical protein
VSSSVYPPCSEPWAANTVNGGLPPSKTQSIASHAIRYLTGYVVILEGALRSLVATSPRKECKRRARNDHIANAREGGGRDPLVKRGTLQSWARVYVLGCDRPYGAAATGKPVMGMNRRVVTCRLETRSAGRPQGSLRI